MATPLRAPVRLLLVLVLSTFALTTQAQVTFTITGTASATALGYTSGGSYAFTFTTSSSFGSTGTSNFDSDQNYWSEEFTTDDALFASVTGDGLQGSLARPTGASHDPNSYIETIRDYWTYEDILSDAIFLRAGADVTDIGLTTNGGVATVQALTLRLDYSNVSLSYPGGYTDPNAYFAAHNLVIAPLGSGSARAFTITTVLDGAISFHVTSVTIATAIPEPSSYAALAGLLALGGVLHRRRVRSAC